MTASIHPLPLREPLRADPDFLLALGKVHGAETDRTVRRRLSALALEVALVGDLVTARDLGPVPAGLRAIRRQAEDLGLPAIRNVALAATEEFGTPAFPAVWARLKRLVAAALDPAQDLSAMRHRGGCGDGAKV